MPSVYKDQIGDRLSSYKLIGVFDMIGLRPLKIYVHFTDFRFQQIKNIVEKPVGQTSIYYLYRLADLAFDENGTIDTLLLYFNESKQLNEIFERQGIGHVKLVRPFFDSDGFTEVHAIVVDDDGNDLQATDKWHYAIIEINSNTFHRICVKKEIK